MQSPRRDAATVRPERTRDGGAACPEPSRIARLCGVLVLVTSLALTACSPVGPTSAPTSSAGASGPTASVGSTPATGSPAASQDLGAIYDAIEEQILAIRGLPVTAPVEPQLLDEAGIRKLTAESFTEENPPELIAANERILKAFGLLSPDASLRDLYIELLGSQVAGLYRPDDKQLYVVSKSGGIGPAEKSAYSHEFTHALQDQNFGIAALKLDEIGQGDRSFARLAVVEGDASLAMSHWQLRHLTQAELGQLVAGAANDEGTKALLAMPPILRESLLFPYVQGTTFVQGIQGVGGWDAVNAIYASPPASTEQILHPEKYASREAPVAVALPADLAARLGSGWTVELEDAFGEFQLGVWLRGNTALPSGAARDAATGWGGDRVAVVNGPDGVWSVVLRTAWDTDADAQEFAAAAGPLVDGLASPGSLLPGAGGTERWIVFASDDTTLNAVTAALGLAG